MAAGKLLNGDARTAQLNIGQNIGQALAQVWLFLVVPTIAGAAAGWLFRAKILEA